MAEPVLQRLLDDDLAIRFESGNAASFRFKRPGVFDLDELLPMRTVSMGDTRCWILFDPPTARNRQGSEDFINEKLGGSSSGRGSHACYRRSKAPVE